MTKMIDILEEYMDKRHYVYFRMDGSTEIADRRDMVNEFQSNSNIFCFLLSTRAGGLVNLTGADTVIFYDNDWNPTMDSQATDRAHRIGQTKEVSVYRLITKNTIEERILRRAKQKQNVQTTVYSGGAFKAEIFKPREIVELLYDDEEIKKMDISSKKLLELNEGGKETIEEGNSFVGKKRKAKPLNGSRRKDKTIDTGNGNDIVCQETNGKNGVNKEPISRVEEKKRSLFGVSSVPNKKTIFETIKCDS